MCERKKKGGGRCRLLLLLSHVLILELLGRVTRADLIPVQSNLQDKRAETFLSESRNQL